MKNFRPYLTKMCLVLVLLSYSAISKVFAQSVTITVDASQGKRAVSPYIYGANNWFDQPAQFYEDAGLRFVRMNGGNNATKYNWRKKISSHPDWYNNVYVNDWDQSSLDVAADHPDMQVMWAFQLLGRVASNTNNNFDDWSYNQAQYWEGVSQNLAGGGVPNSSGTTAAVEGDANLYTQPWPADSSVAILDHWFGPGGLGLNKNQFLYWNMDNEVDIWNGTHDDVMPTLISASAFMDRYIELAKKAKAKFPEIKLCGPVATSEWQWYKWGSESITIDGKYYSWLEYFIKRCADEEKASGVRVLDVLDLHNYPFADTDADALQLHRIYYDETYDYPGANGIKTINGGWDNTQTKEYIFKRTEDWLALHFGADHGITLGISEWGPATKDPNVCSVVYASILGTFANHGVEIFSPWVWEIGMWETLHLFSRYSKSYSVSSTSSLENTVSAYTTVNEAADSVTVIIVNRDMDAARNVTVNLNGFAVEDGNYQTFQLSSLPSTETFVSHTQNALQQSTVSVNSNSLTLSVPSLSTTAVLLVKSTTTPTPGTTTYVTLSNAATGLLIDGMYRTDNGSDAGQYSFSGSDAQKWSIDTVGSFVMLKNKATGLYLDGMGRTSNRSITGQWSYSGSNNQQWTIVNSEGYVKLKNRATDLYIDGLGETTDGAGLGQWKGSNHNNQKWSMSVVENSANARQGTQAGQKSPASESDVKVYPNPFIDGFRLEVPGSSGPLKITIFDLMGKQLETIRYSGESKSLEMGTALKPGLYLVKVNGADWSKSFKVLKK